MKEIYLLPTKGVNPVPVLPVASNTLIATILRYDRKITSYKIALIRALNDVVLSFPDIVAQSEYGNNEGGQGRRDVAVPLRMLAQFWVAYYFPFADPKRPIRQGQASVLNGQLRSDVSFRPALGGLRNEWESVIGTSALPSDGFFLRAEFQTPRRRNSYPPALQNAFDAAVRECMDALEQPIRYAGGGKNEYSVFEKPKRLEEIGAEVIPLPGAGAKDRCLRVSATLWDSFRELSLWIEALCLHEWALFTENIARGEAGAPNRGEVYFLLTARPGNRRPLTWERNRIEILMMEGHEFRCPWTKKALTATSAFDIDHLLPLAVYPANEMWNLLPADRTFNQHTKRDRIPSLKRLVEAKPLVARTYTLYETAPDLKTAMREDAEVRFAGLQGGMAFSDELAERAMRFIEEVANSRGVARF